jgi:LacI family transcriptional regulator
VQRLTIEQIAQLAGVSRGTISRVLNNHPNVRPTVRRHVQSVIELHGYVPRAAAQSLASRRSNLIALLIPRSTDAVFADPFYSYSTQGVIEACARQGFFVTLSMVTGIARRGFMESVYAAHFAGVVTQAVHIDDLMLPQLIKCGVPLVQIGRHPYLDELSWVDVEGRAGACQAVSHLLALGHRRIGLIAGPLYQASALDRRDGYKQALIASGIGVDAELMVEGDWTYAGGYQATRRLLQLVPLPTAIFAGNDLMASGALLALAEAGLAVPDHCAVIGFDDVPMASYTQPPLTTIHQPIFELGAAAADLLVERIAQPTLPPRHLTFPASLVVRQSCGAEAPVNRPGPPVAVLSPYQAGPERMVSKIREQRG